MPSPPPMIRLGRVRGVPIVVAPSWFLIMALLVFVYAPVLQLAVPRISGSTAYLSAAGFAILFGLCVLAHEVGHTLVSMALGHPVRRVVLFVLGGVSEMDEDPERARDDLLISAAGPVVSLLISAGAWFGYDALPAGGLLTALLGLVWWSNLVLAAFNLLPGLPLDGGRILRAVVVGCGARPLTGTRIAAWAGRFLAIGVAVTGLVLDRTALGYTAGLFSVLLAAYLWFASTQALRVATLQARLPDIDVADLLRPGLFVAAGTSVADTLRRAWEGHVQAVVVLDAADRPSAIVDEAAVGSVPPQRRPWTAISDVARPLEPGLMLPDDVDARTLFERMRTTPAAEYLVVHADGSAAGVISSRDFARRLNGLR